MFQPCSMALTRPLMKIVFLVVLLLSLPAPVLAADPVQGPTDESELVAELAKMATGYVITDGTVEYTAEGDTEPTFLSTGSVIPEKTRFATKSADTVRVSLAETGEVSLTGGCSFSLENDDENVLRLYLSDGELEALINHHDNREFEVVTPIAVVGVRGTVFTVAAAADGTTEVYVDTGTVEFNDHFSEEILRVSDGAAAEAQFDTETRYRQFANRTERMQHIRQFRNERRAQFQERIGEVLEKVGARFSTLQQRQREQMNTARELRQEYQELREQRSLADLLNIRDRLRQTVELLQRELVLYRQVARQQRQLYGFQRWVEQLNLPEETPERVTTKLQELRSALELMQEQNQRLLDRREEAKQRLQQTQEQINTLRETRRRWFR